MHKIQVKQSRKHSKPIFYPFDSSYFLCIRYITYVKEEEAIRCIQAVNGFVLDGRPLRYVCRYFP